MERKTFQFKNNFNLELNNKSLHFKKLAVREVKYTSFFALDGIIGSDIFKNASLKLDITNGKMEFIQNKLK